MLDGHVLVLQPPGLTLCRVEQAGQPLGDEHLPRLGSWPADAWPAGQRGLELLLQALGVGAGLTEQARNQPVLLIQQCKQKVLAVHLGVAESQRLGLCVVECFLGLLRQSVGVHVGPPLGTDRLRAAASRTAMRSSRSITSPSAA